MKLTAQRVMQPGTRVQAIHAFHYTHGGYVWTDRPPPNLGNGTLQARRTELPLGGNHVLSYLDIVAPDELPTSRIIQAFAKVLDAGQPPPFSQTFDACTFDSGMAYAFRLGWRPELVRLFEAALAVRVTIV